MQITFISDTSAGLVAQMRRWLMAHSAPEVPAWAPPGSSWLAMPGAPCLVGPDGVVIPINWRDGVATPGTMTVNHDAKAEAEGSALLAATRGAA